MLADGSVGSHRSILSTNHAVQSWQETIRSADLFNALYKQWWLASRVLGAFYTVQTRIGLGLSYERLSQLTLTTLSFSSRSLPFRAVHNKERTYTAAHHSVMNTHTSSTAALHRQWQCAETSKSNAERQGIES